MDKSPDAFRTISEVSEWLDTPAHVLRFWESRFTQVKPVKRAGGRRYYRPADIALLGGIKKLLHEDGLTIRGVQKILREEGVRYVASLAPPFDEIAAEVEEDLKSVVDEIQPLDTPDTEAEILRFPEAAPPATAPPADPPSADMQSAPAVRREADPAPTTSQPDLFHEPESAPVREAPPSAPVEAAEEAAGETDQGPPVDEDVRGASGQEFDGAADSVPGHRADSEPFLAEPEPHESPEVAASAQVPGDPDDHDPMFAAPVPLFPIRNPTAAGERLRASPAEAQAALSRLRALRDRMAIYAR